ncbi:MAG: D-alanyl-D-alanine carboxypeptidase, partial [Erysipelotrichaceae bacterium]
DESIIESKNEHLQKSVASTSKIMSAIIALEQGELKDEIKVSSHILDAYGSSIYLKVNQKISLKSLLYGLLLRSGNDAAIEIAYHISGSEKNFVKEMNKIANEIGMLNTQFHNSSGIDDQGKGNLSTAYDMAILMSYAMKNKNFRNITSAKYYQEKDNKWKNKNRLLFDFPFVNG